MATSTGLPETHRALYLTSTSSALTVKSLPTPTPGPGSAVVKILVANVVSYARSIYNGTLGYPLAEPMVIGSSAIGCIAAVGPDASALAPGQLVLVDINITGRDDANANFLFGIHSGLSPGSRKLMEGEWRDSTYAEYAKVPLENCYALDEKVLLGSGDSSSSSSKAEKGEGGFAYKVEELAYMTKQLVPFGGLYDMAIQPGETVIVAPATGSFGGAAVEVALAMGARVIAAGRNLDALTQLQRTLTHHNRLAIVQLSGSVPDDTASLLGKSPAGGADAYIDFSPASASRSTHLKSCLATLKPFGRAALMGGITDDVALPYGLIMFKSLQLRGRFMYSRGAVRALVRMVENGLLAVGEAKAGVLVKGVFGLDDWDEAFALAEKENGWGKSVLIRP